MKHIIRLSKAGGSVAFNISKIIKKERLSWKEGDFFKLTVSDANEVVIARIGFEKKISARKRKDGALSKTVI